MEERILAVASALFFASSHVAAKKGIQHASRVGGLLVSLGTSWIATTSLVLFINRPTEFTLWGTVFFAAAGVVGQSIGRAALIAGVDRLGPSLSTPIMTSIYPLLALTGAILLFNESVTPLQILGLVGIIVGIWGLSRASVRASPEPPGVLTEGSDGSGTSSRLPRAVSTTLRSGIIFPILGGIAFGVADILRKAGVEVHPDAMFGTMVAATAAFWSWVPGLGVKRLRGRIAIRRRGIGWFAVSGALASGALLTQLQALNVGPVSIVTPIVATSPLMVFGFSAFFLRELESLSRRVVIPGVVIVMGTMLVAA